jgi:hypothetical protein
MSNIDITIPIEGSPTTQSVRDNFATAAAEIDAATAAAAAAQATANGAVQRSGDTMAGPLTLAADPSSPLQPVTLQYYSAHLPIVPAPSSTPPAMNGAVAIGTATTWARADHVHPSDTTKLALAGGTMAGPLLLAADPSAALGTATKQYVDNAVAGATASAVNNKGRNVVHNPLFNVSQRTGPTYTTDGYTLDRWKVTHSGSDTYTISRLALTDADRAAIGDEAFLYALRNVFVGSSVAGSAHYVTHCIEDVHRLSGKTVTVSLWARASAALNLRGLLYQVMGTGGSPSGGVQVGAHDWALPAGTWQRVTWTQAIPSMSGLVVGTNGDSNTSLLLYYSAQGAFVQSGTVDITGVQVEPGNVATQFDKPEYEADIRNCERFYQIVGIYLGIFNTGVGQAAGGSANFRTLMRGAPSLAIPFNGSSNFNVAAPGLQSSVGVFMAGSSAASGNTSINLTIACSADL